MTYGSLFTGAGLGDFGFELAGFECKWQIENDKYCRKILDLRWPDVKKYGDIKDIKTEELEKVDLITGGFPCQPFSTAGRRKGEKDDRNLWPEMFRIIKGIRPRWVVAENVSGIIPLYLDTILSGLETENYEVWPIVFSAHSLGAWHRRERLWIVGYAKSCDRRLSNKQGKNNLELKRASETLANTTSSRCLNKMPGQLAHRNKKEYSTLKMFRRNWSTEPRLGRVVNGCADRVDRLKALGNGQTPCSTFLIGEFIKEINDEALL